MKVRNCIRCGQAYTLPHELTEEQLEGKAFPQWYCAKCVEGLPKLTVVEEVKE